MFFLKKRYTFSLSFSYLAGFPLEVFEIDSEMPRFI